MQEEIIATTDKEKARLYKKNNMLTVIGYTRGKDGRKMAICKCDCGNIKLAKPLHWERGKVKSCGCYARSLRLEHSNDLDRIRRIHNGMVQRCYNPNSHAYKYYGARGITVCDDWRTNRESFIEWSLKNGYRSDLTIDRIDNDGNYSPDNCRWADRITQSHNQRRDNVVPPVLKPYKTWTIDGITKLRKQWCKEYSISYPTVMYRIEKKGMDIKKALSAERMASGRPRRIV